MSSDNRPDFYHEVAAMLDPSRPRTWPVFYLPLHLNKAPGSDEHISLVWPSITTARFGWGDNLYSASPEYPPWEILPWYRNIYGLDELPYNEEW